MQCRFRRRVEPYNDGFVLSHAIDRAAWIAVPPRRDCQVTVSSVDYSVCSPIKLKRPGPNDEREGFAEAFSEMGDDVSFDQRHGGVATSNETLKLWVYLRKGILV
jgi:hypothetical protein